MSVKVGDLYAELKLQKGEFSKGMAEAKAETEEGSSSIGSKIGNMAKIATVAFVAVAAGLVLIGHEAIEAADKHEIAMRSVEQAYGSSAKAVDDWANKNSVAMAVSTTALDTSLGKYGIWAKNVGMSTDDAIASGQALATRAAQIANATGKPFDIVFAALQKGAMGATKGLKEFGVAIDPATIKAKALEMGLYSGKGALDQHAKALATEAIVLQQTSGYIDSATKAQDTLAFKTKQAGVVVDNAFVAIGDAILPLVTDLLTALMPAIIGFGAWVTENSPAISAVIKTVAGDIGTAFDIIAGAFSSVVNVAGPPLMDLFNALAPVMFGLVGLFSSLSGGASSIGPAIGNYVASLQTAIGSIAGKIGPALGQLGGQLVLWIETAGPPALAALGTFLGQVGTWITTTGFPMLVSALATLAQAWVTWITQVEIPALQALAGLLGQVVGWITGTGLPMLASGLVTLGNALVAWIGPMIPPALTELGKLLGQAVGWITGTGVPMLVSGLSRLASQLVAWVGPQIPPLISELGKLLGQAVSWITGTGLPLLVSAAGKLAGAIVAWVGPEIPVLVGDIGDLLGAAIDWIGSTGLPLLVTAATALAIALVNAFITELGLLPGQVGTVITSLVIPALQTAMQAVITFLQNLAPMFLSAAGKIGQAIEDGIMNVVGNVGKMVGDALNSIPGVSIIGGVVGFAVNAATTVGGAAVGAAGTVVGAVVPSHALGLDYVPKDNYLASLHMGEMVLKASDAAKVRLLSRAGPMAASAAGSATPLGSVQGTSHSVQIGDIYVSGVNDPVAIAQQVVLPLKRELARQGMSLG